MEQGGIGAPGQHAKLGGRHQTQGDLSAVIGSSVDPAQGHGADVLADIGDVEGVAGSHAVLLEEGQQASVLFTRNSLADEALAAGYTRSIR